MVTIQINISMDELLSSSTSTPRKNKKGGAPICPVVTGGGLGNRSKHGGPANHGQGVVKGALVRISASCWRGGVNLARGGLGEMEEKGAPHLQFSLHSKQGGACGVFPESPIVRALHSFYASRPQRSIETIASFDQWSGTIENH